MSGLGAQGAGFRVPAPRARRAYRAGQEPGQEASEAESDGELERRSVGSLGALGSLLSAPSAAPLGDVRSVILKEGRRGPLAQTHHKIAGSQEQETTPSGRNSGGVAPVKEKKLESGEVVVVERRRRAVPVDSPLPQASGETGTEQADGEEHLGKRKVVIEEVPEIEKSRGSDDEEDEDDGSDESSGDNIFPSGQRTKVARPVFINETLRRNTTLTEAEEARQKADKQLFQESIKQRNLSLAIESKKERADVIEEKLSDSEVDLPNDSTEDEDVAYEKWKVRELGRLKRDRAEREKLFKEKEAIERRRQMTDEERAKDDKRIGKYKEDQKSHYRFMQKYYSKGVYHIDDDDPLFKRDYNIAVGEDLFDKSVLPGIRHVRRGEEHKKGKSKYTHLVAEDTSNFDPEWMPAEEIREKQKGMMAGYKNASVFERPSNRR